MIWFRFFRSKNPQVLNFLTDTKLLSVSAICMVLPSQALYTVLHKVTNMIVPVFIETHKYSQRLLVAVLF